MPLFVLSLGRKPSPEASRWPAPANVPAVRQFEGALAAALQSLARQRIVWVAGTWLPQTVELGPLARGVRLAR
ncbi:MAG: hypothetical protein KJ062_21640 [Thermoanaerobaculia bacterium]|nr:hypothetical protein [Thermoanaerobaculia bacterium]